MKKYIILFSLILSNAITAQLKIPQLSSTATIIQNIGLTEITINYSRPSTRNRVIFHKNGLVPLNEIWRTGANNATKITFSKDIIIKGNLLKKGSYSFLSIPNATNWQINWYPYKSNNWNSYVSQKPILVINIPIVKTLGLVETFEIHFKNITLNSALLVLEWKNVEVNIPIEINEKEKILKSITKTLSGPSNFDYYNAALYLHETKTNLNKALEYIQKVTKSDDAFFFQVTREAMILNDLGKHELALKTAKRALILSEKSKNDDFIRINKKMIKTLNH